MAKNTSIIDKLLPRRGDSKVELARKIITLVCCVVLIASLAILAWYFVQQAKNQSDIDDMRNKHTSAATVITPATTTETTAPSDTTPVETEPPPLVLLESMKGFVEDNPDTAGWITVPNTNIDNVIVQTDNNDYYLDKDFDGNYNIAGQLYIDFRCIANDYNDNQSDNLIIYGHNQADGTMFGTLKKYKIKKDSTKNFDFYLENPTFTFSNLYEEYTYKIIGMFVIEVEPYQTRDGLIWDYHNYVNFTKKKSFSAFEENLLARTAVNTGVDFNEDDKFITLSTCSNEFEPSRFVVIGRRVRDGESPEVNVSLAEINSDMLEPDYNFIYNQ
ncbi:MAG: class B sortase [Oscillospiraceae bacterium]|nr:class B sortase [Oscillospiraceae bacterium]